MYICVWVCLFMHACVREREKMRSLPYIFLSCPPPPSPYYSLTALISPEPTRGSAFGLT